MPNSGMATKYGINSKHKNKNNVRQRNLAFAYLCSPSKTMQSLTEEKIITA